MNKGKGDNLKLPNAQLKTLPSDANDQRQQQIIASALNAEQSRIKRFIRISLIELKAFYSPQIEEQTEEIFQQTAAKALEKSFDYDENRSAFSWLNGFAANLIKQTRDRTFKERKKIEDGSEDLEKIEQLRRKIETTRLPEETFWEKSERGEDEKFRFERLISNLNADYQTILRLHYFEELNITEIAAHLGKTEGAAQRQLNRAETKLRELLGTERKTK